MFLVLAACDDRAATGRKNCYAVLITTICMSCTGSWLARIPEGSAASWAVGVLCILGPSLLACWYPQHVLASTSSDNHQLNILLLMMGVAVVLLVATQERRKHTLSWAEAQATQDMRPKA